MIIIGVISGSIPGHLLNRNASRSNSPLPVTTTHQTTPTPLNQSNQMQIGLEETDLAPPQDLPPPPPTPDPAPPRAVSPPCNIPPPPPPPPPPPMANGPASSMALTNGDIAKMIVNNPPKLRPLKNMVDGQLIKKANIPLVDPRNDLLKAIRDGKSRLLRVAFDHNFNTVEPPSVLIIDVYTLSFDAMYNFD